MGVPLVIKGHWHLVTEHHLGLLRGGFWIRGSLPELPHMHSSSLCFAFPLTPAHEGGAPPLREAGADERCVRHRQDRGHHHVQELQPGRALADRTCEDYVEQFVHRFWTRICRVVVWGQGICAPVVCIFYRLWIYCYCFILCMWESFSTIFMWVLYECPTPPCHVALILQFCSCSISSILPTMPRADRYKGRVLGSHEAQLQT